VRKLEALASYRIIYIPGERLRNAPAGIAAEAD
jgi:hypothetical protein